MRNLLRGLRATLVALALLPALAASAPVEPAFEGHEYVELEAPVPAPPGPRVQVLELFWYQCPHCARLEPALREWEKRLPKTARLQRLPAVLAERWRPAARLYFALEESGSLRTTHARVFDAYHVEKLNLNDRSVLAGWARKQLGAVKAERMLRAYDGSFNVARQVANAERATQAYAPPGVPAFVVDGKYMTSPVMAGGVERMFEVLDQLLAKAAAERTRKAGRPGARSMSGE